MRANESELLMELEPLDSYAVGTRYLVEEKGFFTITQHLLKIDDSSLSGGITLQTFNAPAQAIPPTTREIRWEDFIAARGTSQPNELIIFYAAPQDQH